MVNILLVEDHHVVRNALKMLLESNEDICIVGEAENGKQALDILTDNDQVDLILTDLNMPVIDGFTLASTLKDRESKIRVIVLSMHDSDAHIHKAFNAGANAYLLKSILPEELLFAIKYVHRGGRYLCASLSMNLLDYQIEGITQEFEVQEIELDLSSRETEVLNLIAEGMTSQSMSDRLFISKRTVEGHRQSLIEKFKVSNTAELIRSAMRCGQIR